MGSVYLQHHAVDTRKSRDWRRCINELQLVTCGCGMLLLSPTMDRACFMMDDTAKMSSLIWGNKL